MKTEQKEKKVDLDVELSTGCGCFTFLIGLAVTIFCIALGILLCKYAWKFLEYVIAM